jgi:hypothetical protein
MRGEVARWVRAARRTAAAAAARPLLCTPCSRCPLHHKAPHLGVAVALVDCGVGGQEVKVAAAVDVPHKRALAAADDDGDGRVVVGAVAVLAVDVLGGGSGEGSRQALRSPAPATAVQRARRAARSVCARRVLARVGAAPCRRRTSCCRADGAGAEWSSWSSLAACELKARRPAALRASCCRHGPAAPSAACGRAYGAAASAGRARDGPGPEWLRPRRVPRQIGPRAAPPPPGPHQRSQALQDRRQARRQRHGAG